MDRSRQKPLGHAVRSWHGVCITLGVVNRVVSLSFVLIVAVAGCAVVSNPADLGDAGPTADVLQGDDDPPMEVERPFPLTPSDVFTQTPCPECTAGCADSACCVGNADCCFPIDDPPVGIHPLTCEGRCDAFGDQESYFDDAVFVPNGNFDEESGYILGEPIDSASQRTELVFSFREPSGCVDGCVESTTVGFVDAEASGNEQRLVAVTAIGQTGRAQIVIAGEVVGDTLLSGTFSIVLRPDRTATILRDGDLVHESSVPVAPAIRVVVSGRNENPDADETPLGVSSLQVNLRVCDMPANWADPSPLRLIEDDVVATALFDRPEDVTAVRHQDRLFVAFVQAGEVVLLGEGERGSDDYLVVARLKGEPYRQPALVSDGTALTLFAERQDISDAWRLERFRFDGSGFSEPEQVVVNVNVTDAAVTLVGSDWLMLARHEGKLAAFHSEDGLTFSYLRTAITGDVSSAALSVSGVTYQLMLEERRGSRSVFSFHVSTNFVEWSTVTSRAFAARGQVASVDVRSPALVTTPSMQTLFFVGTTGVDKRLARATRSLSPGLVLP